MCVTKHFNLVTSITCLADVLDGGLQIEKEFPQILSIHDSLRKFVFEPNAKNKTQVLAAVKEMRGR